jgi:tRNA threonylcarbamoyl adenosine modification protein YeaZ
MFTLFIDTHYKDILLYLFKDNKLFDKKVLLNVKSTSVETMPALIELLDVNNLKVNNINKIAVCVGPGSFTGTRIGVTIAKTLAYANNIDIVSLTSLDLIGLNLDSESYVGVLENNGAFVCNYNKKIISDIKYYKLSEYNEFKEKNKVVDKIDIDDNKLINFINTLDVENCHNVNPLYVKNIEGLK